MEFKRSLCGSKMEFLISSCQKKKKKKSTISKLAVNAVLFHAALGRIRKLLYAAVTAETRLP